MLPSFSEMCVNAEADAIGDRLDNGYIRLYEGTPPDSADAPLTGQRMIAELRFGPDAFPPAVGGLLRANPITSEPSARISGVVAWARLLTASGDVLTDGSVGVFQGNVIIDSLNIVANAVVACLALTYRVPKG